MAKREFRNLLAAALAAATVAGCGGGGESPSPSGVTLTGAVSAPGGTIAFNGPTFAERMFALLAGTPATAAMGGTSGVAGAAVKLIEIDTTGAQVGAALATGTTGAGGSFTLTAPAGFTASAKYVVRASGTTGTIDAIVTTTTASIDVDPSTDASVQIVLGSVQAAGGSLATLDTKAVAELVDQIVAKLPNIDLTGATTAAQVAAAIKTAIQLDEEAVNAAASLAQSGVISGRVTDAAGAALANIKVFALDYNNWVLRAATHTDASGNYTLNLPPSTTQGYVLGAFNFTTTSMAASEWYKAGGHGTSPFQADRVTVAPGTPTTVNLQLANGARISGTVTASDTSAPLAGVRVMLRDLAATEPVTWTRSRADGSYTLNVPAGLASYLLADNFTLQAYGSGVYNGPAAGGATAVSGAVGVDRGTVVTPAAAGTLSANFALIPGRKIAGVVNDGAATPSAVSGIAVRFYDNTGEFVTAMRSNLAGLYRVWLQPNAASAAYVVRARGQTASADLSTADAALDFNAQVNTLSAVLTSDGTTPVSQVKVQVYDAATNTYEGFEISNGDGSVTVYATNTANKKLQALVDGPQAGIGSGWYNGASTRGTATAISFNGANLGSLTLPAGATLSGTVTVTTGGLPAAPGNYIVQVFSGAVSAANFVAASRTQGDGSYSLNLPSGSYNVRSCLWSAAAALTCTSTPTAVTVANPPAAVSANFTM